VSKAAQGSASEGPCLARRGRAVTPGFLTPSGWNLCGLLRWTPSHRRRVARPGCQRNSHRGVVGSSRVGIAAAPGGYPKLHQFAVTQRDLFRVLQPMPGAPQVLRQLSEKKVRIRIITHRLFIKHFHKIAVQQTIEWLDHHDIPYWDLCFMKDKAAVGADLYIEDSPDNVERLRADGHATIVLTNSTNRSLVGPRANSWADVGRLVDEAIQMWAKGGGTKKELAGE
jgi:5'(3')-deoxyribonucleotidase